jgi:hypothetical protein
MPNAILMTPPGVGLTAQSKFIGDVVSCTWLSDFWPLSAHDLTECPPCSRGGCVSDVRVAVEHSFRDGVHLEVRPCNAVLLKSNIDPPVPPGIHVHQRLDGGTFGLDTLGSLPNCESLSKFR